MFEPEYNTAPVTSIVNHSQVFLLKKRHYLPHWLMNNPHVNGSTITAVSLG